MAKNSFPGIYLTLSKIILTLLLGASLYILGIVLKMKYAADTITIDPQIIPYAVEIILAIVVMYLSASFLAIKFHNW